MPSKKKKSVKIKDKDKTKIKNKNKNKNKNIIRINIDNSKKHERQEKKPIIPTLPSINIQYPNTNNYENQHLFNLLSKFIDEKDKLTVSYNPIKPMADSKSPIINETSTSLNASPSHSRVPIYDRDDISDISMSDASYVTPRSSVRSPRIMYPSHIEEPDRPFVSSSVANFSYTDKPLSHTIGINTDNKTANVGTQYENETKNSFAQTDVPLYHAIGINTDNKTSNAGTQYKKNRKRSKIPHSELMNYYENQDFTPRENTLLGTITESDEADSSFDDIISNVVQRDGNDFSFDDVFDSKENVEHKNPMYYSESINESDLSPYSNRLHKRENSGYNTPYAEPKKEVKEEVKEEAELKEYKEYNKDDDNYINKMIKEFKPYAEAKQRKNFKMINNKMTKDQINKINEDLKAHGLEPMKHNIKYKAAAYSHLINLKEKQSSIKENKEAFV